VTPPAPLRIGVLGAARITPMALVSPARRTRVAEVVAVAARDPERAGAFARRHGIPSVAADYDALLARQDVEAVYNPLPNSHHAAWTIRALAAGKHVLCEKPFAATAAEARSMAEAARLHGRVLVEAFHYRYHALFEEMLAVVRSGEIGALRHVEARFMIPILKRDDIRWRRDLAGGAMMDTGCYTMSMLRHLAGSEPTVVRAQARWTRGGVDRSMQADLRFAGDVTGRLQCSLLDWPPVVISLEGRGERGTVRAFNPVAPQFVNRLRVVSPAGTRARRVPGEPSYDMQLRAFVAAVRDGCAVPTGPEDAIGNMTAIEAVYAAAGRPSPA
jgi:predicted dehydrogenase